MFEYKDLFPFPKIREQQKQAIDFVLDSFINKNKKYVLLEMALGGGKSSVGFTVAKYISKYLKDEKGYGKGSWFLTTQKMLQDQYVKDFGPTKNTLLSIKSSVNYKCSYFKDNSCAASLSLLRDADQDGNFYKQCNYNCIYKEKKKLFLNSEQGITNFPYFLTETVYVKKILPRQLIVIDECHNIQEQLSSFVQVVISESFSENKLSESMPKFKKHNDEEKIYNWIKETFLPALNIKIEAILKELSKCEKESNEAKELAEIEEKLKRYKAKIEKFLVLFSKGNWVYNIIESNYGRKIEFKSIDIGEYSQEYLFKYGEKVLMMSATVLGKKAFCETVGLNPDDVAYISIPSTFPVENSPIVYLPAGNLSKKEIDKNLPNLKNIIEILINEEHKNDKGIIHTRTFKISQYLFHKINSKRFILHDQNNKEDSLKKFINSDKPLILLSPSSVEGLDLKDDLSRFQIICKLHYPYLGDKLVKKRMEKYNYWYDYQTISSLLQARGRSVRTENDYATTYILDDSFMRLYKRNISLFPDYFKKALKIM